MPNIRSIRYANRRIEELSSMSKQEPDSFELWDDLAYWHCYVGDYSAARECAKSESMIKHIDQCETL